MEAKHNQENALLVVAFLCKHLTFPFPTILPSSFTFSFIHSFIHSYKTKFQSFRDTLPSLSCFNLTSSYAFGKILEYDIPVEPISCSFFLIPASTPQMSWLSGSTEDTWHPVMSGDTTRTSYWLNWRFLLCAAWILVSMTIAFVLIWRNEQNCQHHEMEQDDDEEEEEGFMYDDQAWMPCLKGVHPAWLLSFRICAFLVLLLLLIASVLVDGNTIFYYYTQWTFTLVTFYFAIGSLMSIGGCFKYNKRVGNVELDAEHGGRGMKGSNSSHYHHTAVEDRQPAGKLVYAFQIIFQINAGAVMLTDCVFWFIIVPFLAIKDFHLSALTICMHSMNAIFLLGDTALNCLPFPIFRIAYFILWTIIYVLFQWFLHAFVKIWWPYPFLDISSPYVPLWYFAVAVMHIPCYGVYAFIVKLKNTWFTRWFLDSYRGWS